MKSYKIVVNKLFFIIFIIFIIFGLSNLFFYKSIKTTSWIHNCFIKKDGYANSINKNKIIFTGGSNTLFGIETHLIEKELNIPVVNAAINAGLKPDYIFYRAKKILDPGDIVIIPLEYESIIWEGYQSKMRIDYILTHDKYFFINYMDYLDQLSMIYSIKPFMLLKSLKETLLDSKNTKASNKGYNAKTLNKNGDETNKKSLKNSLKYSNIMPFEIIDFKETKGLKEIRKFSNWCKKNNIKFYLSFPNTVLHDNYFNNEYTYFFKRLSNYLKENQINTIGKPTDFLYPLEYFYDSTYHLNTYGAKIRTTEFINILKTII